MTARILDRGYRAYEGDRGGAAHAIRVLTRQGVERVMGRRRPVWAKVLAAVFIVMAYLPAVVFVGLTALLSDADLRDLILPTYGEYYFFVTAAIVLFSAVAAPELLCTDRRSGLLGLYLASPLSRSTYLLARVLAVVIVMMIVTLGPPLLLLVAYSLQGAGPDGVVETVEVFIRILGAGVAVAALPAALSLAIAASTDRRAAASAGIILTLLVSGTVSSALLESGDDRPDEVALINLFELPFEIGQRILAEPPRGDYGLPVVDSVPLFAAGLAWFAAFAGFAWWRYQRMEVRR